MLIGDNIRRFRKERGITQKKLGELCGIAEPNIRKYENGKQNPKLETIEKIASALGVTAFDLMGIEYFDLKNPDAGRQYAEYDGFQKYLQSMGFSIKEKQENEDSCSYVISGNRLDLTLSPEEYTQLQTSSGDLIFSYLWKKAKQKNKPLPAATENGK
ncbi:MAG: helix-turn-helix domain-containing protein [Acutalibacteraceae bacterium]